MVRAHTPLLVLITAHRTVINTLCGISTVGWAVVMDAVTSN